MLKGNMEGIMSHEKPILPWDMIDKHTKHEGEDIILDYRDWWQQAWE